MDSLTIQDAFEPYYAGRNSPSKDRRPLAKSGSAVKPARSALPADSRSSKPETDSTTEH